MHAFLRTVHNESSYIRVQTAVYFCVCSWYSSVVQNTWYHILMSELQLDVLSSSLETTLMGEEALSISRINTSSKRFSQYCLDQAERTTVNTINEYWLGSPTWNIFICMEFVVLINFLVTQFLYIPGCFSGTPAHEKAGSALQMLVNGPSSLV